MDPWSNFEINLLYLFIAITSNHLNLINIHSI
jgi:hypothetical protein